ncbi:MAG: tyrosine-type recombinase/integrase [Bacteroidota bacterium]
MATINFYLSTKADTEGKKLIMIFFRKKKEQVVLTTQESVDPKHWDMKLQKARSKHMGYAFLNNNLNKYKTLLFEAYQKRITFGQTLDMKSLKEEFEKILNPDKFQPKTDTSVLVKKIGLIEFVEKHISLVKNSKNPNTIKTYITCQKVLQEFEEKVWKRKILFEDITVAFYYRWKEYVIESHRYNNNSLNKYTGILKLFVREAEELNLHQNFAYKNSKFSTPRVDVDSIFLTSNEIETLLSLDLTKNERLEKVRDLFVVGCWTGLRFSDLSNLKDENIDWDQQLIHISNSIKTSAILDIPIHPIVEDIFKKYKEKTDSHIPISISNQKMNMYLKEIGALAGFSQEVSKVRKVGNTRTNLINQKFELITCHTARRSFASNNYLLGIPPYEIMAITGHKTERAFLTYIKLSRKQHAQSMGARWRNNHN